VCINEWVIGLFVGSGSALATGGPVGLWLGYTLMATMV
jgi:amino acid transporter